MARPMTETRDAPWGWTYAEYARLPDDGNHYEVIDGEVCVNPAPGLRHQRVAARLYRILVQYVEEHALGEVFWDVDLLFQTGQYLRPDMVFVPTDALDGLTDRGVECPPRLVVEVLSPHSANIDRVKKPPRYRDFGVPEYWVVDPVAGMVEVHRPELAEPDLCRERVRWWPDPESPALEIEVAKLFAF